MALTGSGTEADPYQITSSSDWTEINNDVTAYYELQNDIDFGNGTIASIDNTNNFTGTIDGNGYAIRNVQATGTYDTSQGGRRRSLIDNLGGVVKNISFIDWTLDFGSEAVYLIDNLSGELSNITFDNISFLAGDFGSGIMGSAAGSSEIVSGVEILNSTIEDVDGDPVFPYRTNSLENVLIKNTVVRVIGDSSMSILVRPLSITGLRIVDCEFESQATSSFNEINVINDISDTYRDIEIDNINISYTNITPDEEYILDIDYNNTSSATLKNVSVRNVGSTTGSSNASIIQSGASSVSYEDIFVTDTSGYTIFNDTGSSNTVTDAYYNSETTDNSPTQFTALTTSEMTGDAASTNMNFDFTNDWFTVENDYPRVDNFYSPPFAADITLNSPKDGANFVSGEQFAFDFQVVNNEGSLDATVNLNVNDPDGTSSNPISQSLTAGSSQTYNSSYTSSTLGSGSWEVVADAEGRSPVSESRVFEIFDESELSFDVDATDLSRVFFDAEIVGSDQVSYTVFVNGTERFSSDLSPAEHGVKTRSVDVSAETGATTVAVRVETGQNSTGSGLEVFNIRTDQVI